MREDSIELDVSRLGEPSRILYERLTVELPRLSSFARMVPTDERDRTDLLIEIPSPTGDEQRKIVIWMDDGIEASIGFGAWHTHATCETQTNDLIDESNAILALAKAIIEDNVVLFYDVGGEYDGQCGIIDLRLPDAILEEITDQYSPGQIRIATWSGKGDREVDVNDLSHERVSKIRRLEPLE